MGYELHIVRNDKWWDEDTGGGIPFDEWSSLIESDDSMRMEGYAEVTLPGNVTLRVESNGLAIWTKYAGNENGGNQAWFDFRENRIVVKNPDQDILRKMLEIACVLNAKIVGDDDEEYISPSDHGMPERSTRVPSMQRECKPWWLFW